MIGFTPRNSGHIVLLGHCQLITQQHRILVSGITPLLDLSFCNWYRETLSDNQHYFFSSEHFARRQIAQRSPLFTSVSTRFNSVCCCIYYVLTRHNWRSQWLRGLRRRFASARLLRLWVRIPLGAWMSVVSVLCCQVEVSTTS